MGESQNHNSEEKKQVAGGFLIVREVLRRASHVRKGLRDQFCVLVDIVSCSNSSELFSFASIY